MKTKTTSRRKVSKKHVRLCACLQFTDEHICEVTGCTPDALQRNYAHIIAWRLYGREKIRARIAKDEARGDTEHAALMREIFPGIEAPENNREKQDSDV